MGHAYQTKFTPGNWEADGSAVFVGKNCIALTDTDNATEERYVANAHLIAAAPDLYAALVVTLDIARRNESGSYVDDAVAALAKARGEPS